MLKELTREESQKKIAAEAKHRVVDPSKVNQLKERQKFRVERREHILKNNKGQPIKDLDGNVLKTKPFHREVIVDGHPDMYHPEGLLSVSKPSTSTAVLEKDDTLNDLMSLSIPEIKKHIENSNPGIDKLQAMKKFETEHAKRPQAYKMLNEAIIALKGNN